MIVCEDHTGGVARIGALSNGTHADLYRIDRPLTRAKAIQHMHRIVEQKRKQLLGTSAEEARKQEGGKLFLTVVLYLQGAFLGL